MFVADTCSEEGGFTRITFGGIESQRSAHPDWQREQVLTEQIAQRVPSAHGFMARVLSAPDRLIYSVRTDVYTSMGATVLGNAHDVICAAFGPQHLEYMENEELMTRESDGSIHGVEPAVVLLPRIQPAVAELVA